METRYLDIEINRMNWLNRDDSLSEDGKRMLKEFKAIKEALNIPLVIESKNPNIHNCLNDLMEITDRRLGGFIYGVVKQSLRFEFKRAIDKMICSR